MSAVTVDGQKSEEERERPKSWTQQLVQVSSYRVQSESSLIQQQQQQQIYRKRKNSKTAARREGTSTGGKKKNYQSWKLRKYIEQKS